MEKYRIEENLSVFGKEVKTFPTGIGQAFDELVALFPKDDERPYYGISLCTENGIVYHAAALEKFDGEAESHRCERYTIEKGDYLAVSITDWQEKTDMIGEVFKTMFTDERCDPSKPSVEIYKNMKEMVCLVKERPPVEETVRSREALLDNFDAATKELFTLLGTFNPAEMNVSIPANSWSAAQVAEHLFKTDTSMLRILTGPATSTNRPPDMKVANLKAAFLNFDVKMESPRFARPLRKIYDKETLLNSLTGTRSGLREVISTQDLSATCTTIEVPAMGDSTRLELLHFVLYHTQRHNHQLRKIFRQVTSHSPAAQHSAGT